MGVRWKAASASAARSAIASQPRRAAAATRPSPERSSNQITLSPETCDSGSAISTGEPAARRADQAERWRRNASAATPSGYALAMNVSGPWPFACIASGASGVMR